MPSPIILGTEIEAAGAFRILQNRFLQGSFRPVADASARTGIDSTCLLEGMLVYQVDTGQFWQLESDLTTWHLSDFSGGAVPTGTGFVHITSGVQDGAAKLVQDADVASGAAIAATKIAVGTAHSLLQTDVTGAFNFFGLIEDANVDIGASIAVSKLAFGLSNRVLTTDAMPSVAQWTLLVNANIDAAAAIAVSKIAHGTANQVLVTDGTGVTTQWTSSLVVSALSVNGLTGVLRASSGTVGVGTVVDADVASGAAIVVSKLAGGTSSYVLTTSGSTPTWAQIVNANVASGAAIDVTKLANGSANTVLVTASVTPSWIALTDAYIASGAAIAVTKLAIGAANTVLSTNSGATANAFALLVNANVDAAAAIAGTKISPAFGSQNISTSGTASLGATTVTALTIGSLSGVLKGASGVVSTGTLTNSDVSAGAAIDVTKLALGSTNTVLWSDGAANQFTGSPVLTTLTVSSSGAVQTASGNLNVTAASAALLKANGNPLLQWDAASLAGRQLWDSGLSSVTFQQSSISSGTAANMILAAQTSTAGTGGDISLRSGTGATANGAVHIGQGSTDYINVTAAGKLNFGSGASAPAAVGAHFLNSQTYVMGIQNGTTSDSALSFYNSGGTQKGIFGYNVSNTQMYLQTVAVPFEGNTSGSLRWMRVESASRNVTFLGGTIGAAGVYGGGEGVMSFATVTTGPTTSAANQAILYNTTGNATLQGHTGVVMATQNQAGTGISTIAVAEKNGFTFFAGTGSYGGGIGVISLTNCNTVPTSNPTGGGIQYASGGALYWRSPNGVVTTIAPS